MQRQPPPRIRILLVDDQPLFRKALASLFASQPDMTVVGEAENGLQALDQAKALHPDLVLMDVQMPAAGGVEGVRLIRQQGLDARIVMLTVSEDDDDLFESVKAGANGYLLKNVRPDQLYEALRGVMRGEAPISPAVADKLLAAFRRLPPTRTREPAAAGELRLTSRETEVLRLVAEGLSNKEIAARLTITEGTVKNHVHNALEKLHLNNRAQAAAYAVRMSLEPPGGRPPEASS